MSTFSGDVKSSQITAAGSGTIFAGPARILGVYWNSTAAGGSIELLDNAASVFKIDVPGRIYECVDLKIYNRWGQVMFISTGNNLKWDGRTSVGEKVPGGTYFYTIEIKDHSYNGSLYLFN